MISLPRLSTLTYFSESLSLWFTYFEIGFETLVTVYEMDFLFFFFDPSV